VNEKIKSMLEQAGFCLWNGESWAPKDALVDWNSDYTVEFNDFIMMIITECANVAANSTGGFKQQVYDAVVNNFTDVNINFETDRNTNDFTPYEPSEIDEWESYDKDC
jgi:hypothetical protein